MALWVKVRFLLLALVFFSDNCLYFINLMFFVQKIVGFLIILVPILVAVAYLTLAERKVMGAIQQRRGPNVAGFLGLLQPAADGVKLVLKETIIPTNASTFSFIFAPMLTLFLSLLG